jgi:hypothetical protein
MSFEISFTAKDWETRRKDYTAWWRGEANYIARC